MCVAAATALLLCGCAGRAEIPPGGARASSDSNEVLGNQPPAPAPPGVPEAADDDRDDSQATVRAPASEPTGDADRREATAVAVQAMRLYARRDVTAQQWLNDLLPLMSAQGGRDLIGTDPRNVPPTRVTGPGRSQPLPTQRLASIMVPTDTGDYRVLLSRTPEQKAWKVERITSPAGQG